MWYHPANDHGQALEFIHPKNPSTREHPKDRKPMILYGISTCDTCKKALKALERAGKDVTFRDIRATPLTPAEIEAITREFGDLAVNRQSTTYRSFSDFLKASDPEAQIMAQPTVMKRPVIQDGDRWYLGWDSTTEAALTA
jgi:arsenate reductase (glutaredoxin)